MTDKEIIIDGVDVSECEKLGETIDGITCGLGKRIRFANEIITKHNLCKNNPNCYYKQLKRKEQECEELKEHLNQAQYLSEGTLRLYSERQNIKCKQALDEIENYVRDNSDFDKNDKLTSNTGAYDILEIINKAKAVSAKEIMINCPNANSKNYIFKLLHENADRKIFE